MQRIHKLRLNLVNQIHQADGLRNRLVVGIVFIVEREIPFNLFIPGRAEVMTGKVGQRDRSLEPAFVELRTVEVDAFDQIPGIIQFFAQIFIFGQRPVKNTPAALRPSVRWDADSRTSKRCGCLCQSSGSKSDVPCVISRPQKFLRSPEILLPAAWNFHPSHPQSEIVDNPECCRSVFRIKSAISILLFLFFIFR